MRLEPRGRKTAREKMFFAQKAKRLCLYTRSARDYDKLLYYKEQPRVFSCSADKMVTKR